MVEYLKTLFTAPNIAAYITFLTLVIMIIRGLCTRGFIKKNSKYTLVAIDERVAKLFKQQVDIDNAKDSLQKAKEEIQLERSKLQEELINLQQQRKQIEKEQQELMLCIKRIAVNTPELVTKGIATEIVTSLEKNNI